MLNQDHIEKCKVFKTSPTFLLFEIKVQVHWTKRKIVHMGKSKNSEHRVSMLVNYIL